MSSSDRNGRYASSATVVGKSGVLKGVTLMDTSNGSGVFDATATIVADGVTSTITFNNLTESTSATTTLYSEMFSNSNEISSKIGIHIPLDIPFNNTLTLSAANADNAYFEWEEDSF
jgi:hypothetical protein